MSGIENLTSQILLDAEEKASGILLDAREKAEEILSLAKQEAEEEFLKAAAKAEEDAAVSLDRVRSQIGMQKRQTLLKARQDAITEVINGAKASLQNQDDASYEAMLLTILENHVRPGSGELLLSARDYARVSPDFAVKAQQIAAVKGGKLTVTDQAATLTKVEDGFVLLYGGIEENCTLEALFQDRLDDLKDAASRKLFEG